MESVISASTVVLVIRTQKPFFRSMPSKYLLMATLVIVGVTLLLPFTPLGEVFGFSHLPVLFILIMGMIVALYIILAEVAKAFFYRKVKF